MRLSTRLEPKGLATGESSVLSPDAKLILSFPGKDDFVIWVNGAGQPPLPLRKRVPTVVGDWKGVSTDEGDEAAAWLRSALGLPEARLRRYVGSASWGSRPQKDPTRRAGDPGWAPPKAESAFTDGFPLTIASRASLVDLEQRAALDIPVSRFRPNVVIEGGRPFREDGWTRVAAGGVELELLKPIAVGRSQAVDPATGRIDASPIEALRSFRLGDHLNYFVPKEWVTAAFFGWLCCYAGKGDRPFTPNAPALSGTIRVGDAVRVLERRTRPPAPGQICIDPSLVQDGSFSYIRAFFAVASLALLAVIMITVTIERWENLYGLDAVAV